VRVLEIRVLREMFGIKKGEVTGGWRRLHNVMPYVIIVIK
jgi:hypothetical protein